MKTARVLRMGFAVGMTLFTLESGYALAQQVPYAPPAPFAVMPAGAGVPYAPQYAQYANNAAQNVVTAQALQTYSPVTNAGNMSTSPPDPSVYYTNGAGLTSQPADNTTGVPYFNNGAVVTSVPPGNADWTQAGSPPNTLNTNGAVAPPQVMTQAQPQAQAPIVIVMPAPVAAPGAASNAAAAPVVTVTSPNGAQEAPAANGVNAAPGNANANANPNTTTLPPDNVPVSQTSLTSGTQPATTNVADTTQSQAYVNMPLQKAALRPDMTPDEDSSPWTAAIVTIGALGIIAAASYLSVRRPHTV